MIKNLLPVYFFIVLLSSGALHADNSIYKYKDANGVVQYVDDINRVPEKFRSQVQAPHKLPVLQRENTSKNKDHKKGVAQQRVRSNSLEVTERQLAELNADISDDPVSTVKQPEQVESLEKEDTADLKGLPMGFVLLGIVVFFVNLVAYWVLLNRAGLPGFGIIIPFYNLILLSRLAGKSGWWVLWVLVPFFGSIFWSASVSYSTAKNFDRSDLFAFCNIFVPFLLVPVMAASSDSRL